VPEPSLVTEWLHAADVPVPEADAPRKPAARSRRPRKAAPKGDAL
jgi:hypothetical protein